MKVAIIGIGSIGAKHARNIAQLDSSAEIILVRHKGPLHRDASLQHSDRAGGLSGKKTPATALRDHNPYVEELKSSLPRWKEVCSVQEALLLKPDAVLICNPTSLHVGTALDVIPHCSTLFIEKPLSHSRKDVEKLAGLAKRHKTEVFIGYTLRWHPVIRRIKKWLEEGHFGKVYSASAISSSYLPSWRERDYRTVYSAQQSLGGGVILDLSHEIDYLLWYFGKASQVKALSGHVSDLETDAEDTADMLLRHESGVISHVHVDCTTKDWQRTITIQAERGTIKGDILAGTILATRDGEPIREKLPESNYLLDEMRHFLNVVQGEEGSAIPLEDGIAVLEVCLQAKGDVAQGRVQKGRAKGSAKRGR